MGGKIKTTEQIRITILPDSDVIITDIIQQAIDSCSAVGAGTVYFPSGKYLTGGIPIKSNVTLQFEKGAVLQGSDNYLDYGEGKWTDALIAGDGPEPAGFFENSQVFLPNLN